MGFATDVFVIGGGPAGLGAAIAARAKGLRVTVADGGVPPIDKPCGEGLLPDTLAALRELGVEVHPGDGHALRGIRFVGSGSEVAAGFPAGCGIGIRRPVLHRRLIDRAAEVGVSLRWKTPVSGISAEGVVASGEVVSARWIVGADGINSRVRKWAGLEARWLSSRRFAQRQHYRVSPWTDFVEIYWGENAQAYVTPVGGDEIGVVTVSRHSGLRGNSLVTEFPELARRLAGALPVKTERGAVTSMQRLGAVHRGNVALVGDASGSVDAITGDGLCLGFRQALVLAEALEAGDLRGYARAHRRMARRPAIMGRLMLTLDGRTKLRERVFRALASDANLFSRMVAIHVGASSGVQLASAGAMLGWRLVGA